MLQRFRERLTILLIVLLPFHALMVTVATRVIAGPGHAPLGVVALWKEILLVVILGIALVEIVLHVRLSSSKPEQDRHVTPIDRLDVLILVLGVIALLVALFLMQPLKAVLYGVRYDFVPLVAFLTLRRVSWSEGFAMRVLKAILWTGIAVSLYSLFTAIAPQSFFTSLGYSDLHSLYLPDKPIAAFQMIEHSALRRLQGPMSGPNHLGLWMLIPLAAAIASLVSGGMENGKWKIDNYMSAKFSIINFPLSIFCALALFTLTIGLSFSRASWIAVFVIVAYSLWHWATGRHGHRIILALGGLGVIAAVAGMALYPSVFLRLSSTRGHWERPLEAVHLMIKHPFGMGLASAGPASNRLKEPCVMLRAQDDPSWAKDRPSLCVFTGDVQVQPLDHACDCPVLTENWYLQIGVETGWVGMVLFMALAVSILIMLYRRALVDDPFAILLFLSFVGISIGAVFLHAWEDSAVAYTLWILIGVCFSALTGRVKEE